MPRYFVKKFRFDLPFEQSRWLAADFDRIPYTFDTATIVCDDRLYAVRESNEVVSVYRFGEDAGMVVRAGANGLEFLAATKEQCTRAALPPKVVETIEGHIRDYPMAFDFTAKSRIGYGSDLLAVLDDLSGRSRPN